MSKRGRGKTKQRLVVVAAIAGMLPFEEQVVVDLMENPNRGRDGGVQQEGPED
jgi:hypothetical protein